MNKPLAYASLAVGLVGVAWAGATLYIGAESRAAYAEFVAGLDAASGFGIATESMDAGFAASRAVTVVRASSAPGAPVLARLVHDVEHSPIGFADGPRVGAARIITTLEPDASAPDASPVTLVSVAGFDGAADHVLSVAGWRATTPRGAWQIVAAEYAFRTARDGAVTGTGTGGHMVFEEDGVRLELTGLEDAFEYRRDGAPLALGEYSGEARSLSFDAPSLGEPLRFGDVELVSRSDIVDGALELSGRMASAAVDAPLDIDTASVVVTLGDVDADAFAAWSGGAADSPSVGGLARVVRPGAFAAYAVELGNAGGRVDLALDARYANEPVDAPETVGDLLRTLSGSLTVEADPDALRRTPAAPFLDPSVLTPWVDVDGPRWRTVVTLEDMVVDVNGQAFPLVPLLGEQLDVPLDAVGAPPARR